MAGIEDCESVICRHFRKRGKFSLCHFCAVRLLSLEVSVYDGKNTCKTTRYWAGCPSDPANHLRVNRNRALAMEHFDPREPTAIGLKPAVLVPLCGWVCRPPSALYREGQVPSVEMRFKDMLWYACVVPSHIKSAFWKLSLQTSENPVLSLF